MYDMAINLSGDNVDKNWLHSDSQPHNISRVVKVWRGCWVGTMLRGCWIVDMSWLCLITNTTTSCQWAKCGADVEWGQCWYANILCCFFLSIIKCNQLPVNTLPTQHSPLVVNWKGIWQKFSRNTYYTEKLFLSFCRKALFWQKPALSAGVLHKLGESNLFDMLQKEPSFGRKNSLLAERTIFWQKELLST